MRTRGGAPRRTILRSKPPSAPVTCRRSGTVTARQVSTLGSMPSLVIPRSVIANGCTHGQALSLRLHAYWPMPTELYDTTERQLLPGWHLERCSRSTSSKKMTALCEAATPSCRRGQ